MGGLMLPLAQASHLAQINRLRKLAELAVTRFPVAKPTLYFINHGENTTFRVEGRDGKKFLLRIHRAGYHRPEAIGEELAWLDRLGKGGEVTAPRPVRSKRGKFLESVEAPGVDGARQCDLLRWVEGRFVYKSATEKTFRELGRLMARLHASNQKKKVVHRRYWDAEGLLGKRPTFGPIDQLPGVPAAQQRLLLATRREVLAYLRRYERKHPERQGLIHADLHFGNFLVRKDGIGAIDFDDSGFGFHAYDLVVPLTQITHLCKKNSKKSFPAFVAALQEGYASEGRWDAADAAALPYLFAARRLVMLGWLNSRADIPEFRERLPATAKHVYEYLKTEWRALG